MGVQGDVVEVDIGGETFAGWTSYSIESDLLTPADGWELEIPLSGTLDQRRRLLARIREAGLRCFLHVARTRPDGSTGPRLQQLAGIIDKRAVNGGRDGDVLTLSGRDNGGLLVSADADPRLGVTSETTLVEVARAICEPFGITVITEAAPSRLLMSGAATSRQSDRLLAAQARSMGIPRAQARRSLARRRSMEGTSRSAPLDESVGAGTDSRAAARARRGHGGGQTGSDIERIRVLEAKPQVGETCWDFLDRHCRRFGVLPWIDAQGRLVISSPDYDQEPLFRFTRRLSSDAGEPNNIISGGFVENIGELSSECTVYGRARGDDASRSPFHATETNPNQPFYRPLVLHDNSVRSEAEAQRRARRELNRQNEQGFALEYDVHGHGQGDLVFTIDTVADVVDEAIGIEGLYYVVSRTLRADGKNGKHARVRLVPLGAIAL